MDCLRLKFIKETKETELPLKPGVTVIYNGSEYQAVSQDTGKQGWWWKIIKGNVPYGQNEVFLTYDDPIYALPRYNPLHSTDIKNKLVKTKDEREVVLPDKVVDPLSAYEFAISIEGRPQIVKDVEYLIAKNPYLAVLYARRKGFTFDYALENIKKDPNAALSYAKYILNHRWNDPQVEKMILQNPTLWSMYKHIFKF